MTDATQATARPEAANDDCVSLELESVRRAATGDRRAQAWLARRLVGKVRKVTRALAKSAADSDDAAQLSLLEILRSAHSFRGDSSLEHWAGRIAARTTLRFLSRERKALQKLAAHGEVIAPAVERAGDSLPRDVREYLGKLPESQRTAIVLHHALGHSLDEIAALTEVSRNTVKGRLRLGTAALRKLVRRERLIGRGREPA